MVDLRMVKNELELARRARREAQIAGLDLERLIERMQAGRTLQQIELEDMPAPNEAADFAAYRQAA
jgi:hypothetical protein